MKTKIINRGGVLLLALILAVNMLMPASVWAVPEPGCVEIVIDGNSYFVYQPGGWEWVYDYTPKEVFVSSYIVPDISFDSEDRIIYQEKYLTFDGSTPVVKTDAIIEGGSYTTMAVPLDFTAPESLSMRATQGSSELSIDPCVINNTGTEDLKLSQVEITAATGWTVVDSSTDFTTADSKNKIAFKTGTHDFSSGAYSPGEKITAGGNATVQLEGKISEKADLTNATQVASMIVTVEKNVSLISFTIAGTSYQAEEGMMWEEWIASDYNTGNTYGKYSVNEYGSIGYLLPKGYWVAIHDSEKSDYVSPTDTIKSDFEYDAV